MIRSLANFGLNDEGSQTLFRQFCTGLVGDDVGVLEPDSVPWLEMRVLSLVAVVVFLVLLLREPEGSSTLLVDGR